MAVAIATLVDAAERELAAGLGGGARREACRLLAHCAGLSTAAVLAFPERPVGTGPAAAFRAAVARRALGEPLAYITGSREFYSLRLAVTPAVLVPRPETETLVEAALEYLPRGSAASVIDLGTGSGAIALALKHERPSLAVTGVDRDAAALAVARANGERLGLAVRWQLSDWFEAVGGERFELVVANPPYVASGDPHFTGPLRFEPKSALDGGEDGLAAYRAILGAARGQLVADGLVLLEHGFDQRSALTALADTLGYATVFVRDDLAGQPRVVALRLMRP